LHLETSNRNVVKRSLPLMQLAACLDQVSVQATPLQRPTCASAQVPQLPRTVQLHLGTCLLFCIALLLRLSCNGPEPITLALLLLLFWLWQLLRSMRRC
jgi:hypothetical protein